MLKQLLIIISISIWLNSNINAQLKPQDAVLLMQKGVNLGNTLEPPLEGQWGNPVTQEFMFDNYKNAGFNLIRIPVTWDMHTASSSPYKVDAGWLNRVEQIVDWGLSKGLYIVLNAHHETWLKEHYSEAAQVRFDSIWSQIAMRFRNKSDKLIFEILNEPHIMTMAQSDTVTAHILPIIRKTNPTRIVIFQGPDWGSSEGLIGSAIPNDSFLIGSFHSYDPWPFGLQGTGTFSSSDITALTNKFNAVKSWSVAHNIPVFLGEFGAFITADYNSVMTDYNTYVDLSQKNGFAYCAWEDGGDFKLLDRTTGKWNDTKDILIHSSLDSPKNPALALFQDTIIKLSWTNKKSDYDSLFVERKLSYTDFVRVASLSGNSTSYLDMNLPQNAYYYYRVIAHYNSGTDLYSHPMRTFLPYYVQKYKEPYFGTPAMIPGVIEAENFDKGGEGLGYHDADPKNIGNAYRLSEGVDIYAINDSTYEIGNVMPGEWYEYTVHVSTEADYNIDVYIAAVQDGGSFKLKIGDNVSDTVVVKSTGSLLKTKAFNTSMHLMEGDQLLRFNIISQPIFDIDKMDFSIVNAVEKIKTGNGNPEIFVNSNREVVVRNLSSEPLLQILIFNSNGEMVRSVKNPVNSELINTTSLAQGLYIINAISNHNQFSEKVILR